MRLSDEAFQKNLCSQLSLDDRFLVGVSGGRDSMVLLHFLQALGFENLIVCHVNHQLRGSDSDDDEDFVRKQTADFGYSFFFQRKDVRVFAGEEKLSLETAAREVRYRFFSQIAVGENCPRLLLAHHADDQVETVLMNLFRGAGLKGLGGMRQESELDFSDSGPLTVLRPFLEIPRSEIDDYVKSNNIIYREDETNIELFALRNRLRHRLIPEINEIFERDVRTAVLRLAETARLDSDDAVQETVALYYSAFAAEANGSLVVPILRGLSESKRRRLILYWLKRRGICDCGHAEAKRISAMVLSDSTPAKINLPGDHFARRRAGLLFLEGRQ